MLAWDVQQVYSRLARAREWGDWAQVVRLIHTAQPDELQSGNTLCYTSNLVPGFVDGTVQDAETEKVCWHPLAAVISEHPFSPSSSGYTTCIVRRTLNLHSSLQGALWLSCLLSDGRERLLDPFTHSQLYG